MKKIIRNWSGSLVIKLSPEDAKIYRLSEGDIIDMKIVGIVKKDE